MSHMSHHLKSQHSSQFYTELNLALELFFSGSNSYFNQYYPRPLRLFLIKLLTHMLKDEISVIFNVSKIDVTLLLDTLTSKKPYITVMQKKRVKLLLHTIRDHNFIIKIPPTTIPAATIILAQSVVSWPNDILGYDDLKDSLIGWTLRDDVGDYLIYHLATLLPSECYSIGFNHNIEHVCSSNTKVYPIHIAVEESKVAVLIDYINTQSLSIEKDEQDCLLPNDLIAVIPLLDTRKFELKEEEADGEGKLTADAYLSQHCIAPPDLDQGILSLVPFTNRCYRGCTRM